MQQAANRPCARGIAGALLCQKGGKGRVRLHPEARGLHPVQGFPEAEGGDPFQALLGQRPEGHHRVHPAQELWREGAFDPIPRPALSLRRAFFSGGKARRRLCADGAGVGGHDQDRIAKVRGPAQAVGKAAVL